VSLFYPQFIGENGVVEADEIMEQAADVMLDELVRLDAGLRQLRETIAEAA
jgi:hypothetical protein